MSQPPNTEMIKGFIEEVQSYIPSLIGGLESLEEAPDLSEALEETHRLVHTIKGASSMVGLAGLSQVAFQMEEYLFRDALLGIQFHDRQNCVSYGSADPPNCRQSFYLILSRHQQ